MKYLYRKAFSEAAEAEAAVKGFFLIRNIDRLGEPEVSVSHDGDQHYVYVALEGDFDPDEVLAATGYERVS